MNLQIKEREISKEFKQELIKRYPMDIEDVVIFGSKARGDATEKSDIDVLVITKSDNWIRGDEIRRIGYSMDEELDYKFSIQVLSRSYLDSLKSRNFNFANVIDAEGISL